MMGKQTCLTPILEGEVHSYSHCGEGREEWPILMNHNETITNKMLSYSCRPPQKHTRLLRSVTVVWDLLSYRFDRLQEISRCCSWPKLTQNELPRYWQLTFLHYTLYILLDSQDGHQNLKRGQMLSKCEKSVACIQALKQGI